MRKGRDITGQKFNKLTAIRKNEKTGKWLFKCDCGNEIWLKQGKVTGHKQTSCGCGKEQNTFIDRAGKRYGKLVCLSYDKEKKKWLCLCDCGNTCYKGTNALNLVKSCGCINKERFNVEINHLPYYEKIYNSYRGMRKRCYYKKDTSYKWYGAKGIKVCDEWQNSMISFYNWAINNGYDDKLQIDRIDSNKNYCPENCRWIDASENISRAGITERMKVLNETSTDEVVKKFALKKLEILEKEKNKPKSKHFFFRKPTYSHLMSVDGKKRYIFRRQKDICLFLDISYGALNYRIHNKNGMIGDNWKYEKIDKEIFEIYKKSGIEVIS